MAHTHHLERGERRKKNPQRRTPSRASNDQPFFFISKTIQLQNSSLFTTKSTLTPPSQETTAYPISNRPPPAISPEFDTKKRHTHTQAQIEQSDGRTQRWRYHYCFSQKSLHRLNFELEFRRSRRCSFTIDRWSVRWFRSQFEGPIVVPCSSSDLFKNTHCSTFGPVIEGDHLLI